MIKQDTSNTAQAMWIGIGSLFSFLFSIVSAVILSRYLTKDAYGTYKQVMYVYTTLLSVFTLGLPLAYSYFLPRVSMGEGRTLTNKLNRVFLVLGGVFALVLFFGADIIADILKNPSLEKIIKIKSGLHLPIIQNSNNITLFSSNVSEGGNDIQIRDVNDYYINCLNRMVF